jgi:ribosome-binding factor A
LANSRTLARIAARIKERAAHAIEFELSDPRSSFITITEVKVSSDLSIATILYSVLGSDGDKSKVKHMLADAGGFIQRKVGRVLTMRRVPKLRFIYDDSIEKNASMDALIRDAIEGDRGINPGAHDEINLDKDDSNPNIEVGPIDDDANTQDKPSEANANSLDESSEGDANSLDESSEGDANSLDESSEGEAKPLG